MPRQVLLKLDSFQDGLATTVYSGGAKQFAYGSRNIDFFTDPGIIQPVIALQRDIGDPVTNAVGSVYKASNGTAYWLGIPSANTLQMYTSVGLGGSSTTLTTSGASVSLTGASAGAMVEFADFLFFYDSGLTDLGKFNITTPAITTGQGSVASNNVGSDLLVFKSFLYYCSGTSVGRATNDTTYNATALTLETRYRVTTLTAWNNYVLVGAQTRNESGLSRIFVWDGVSTNYDYSFDLPSTGLRATVNNGGIIYFFCVNNPNGNATEPNRLTIYRWSGGTTVQLVRDFDLQATSTNLFTGVSPSRVTAYKGKVFFTIGAATANTMGLQNGVYSINNRGALNLEYIDETGTVQDINGTFLKWIDGQLFWFWDDGTNNRKAHQFGQTYSSVARLDTLALQFDPRYEARIDEIFFRSVSSPASTSVAVSIATDQATFAAVKTFSATSSVANHTINQNDYAFQPGHVHQLRFAFSSSSSSRFRIILPIYIKATVFDHQTLTS